VSESESELATLESKIGYAFRRPEILRLALTHPSARTELDLSDDNQRLEFVGDAVLGLLAAEYGYLHFHAMDEGDLTQLRTTVTRTGTLAEIGRGLGLGAFMIFGRGEAAGGGAIKARNLADAVEALIGAAYLDGGLPAASRIFTRLFTGSIGDPSFAARDNPKGLLQELAQKKGLPLPGYAVLSEEGPSHHRHFTIQVRIGDSYEATGSGSSKRIAEAAAATTLLTRLRQAQALET